LHKNTFDRESDVFEELGTTLALVEQQMLVLISRQFFLYCDKFQKTSSKLCTHKLEMPGRRYNSCEVARHQKLGVAVWATVYWLFSAKIEKLAIKQT